MKRKKLVSMGLVMTIACTMFAGCGVSSVQDQPAAETPVAETAEEDAVEIKEDAIVFKIGNAVGESHQNSLVMRQFLEPEIEKRSGGRYDVECYVNGTLGDDNAMVAALREGTLDAYIGGSGVISGLVPGVSLLELPFVFDDRGMAEYIMDGEYKEIIGEQLYENGLVLWGFSENGFTQFINNEKEIRTPEDLKGMTLRVMQNPIRIATFEAYGANGTPMSFNDVFSAMQQHTVNGMESTLPLLESGKFYEAGKYLTIANNSYFANVLLMSRKVYDAMSDEDKAMFDEIGLEAVGVHRKYAVETNESALEILKENCQVYELTEEERQLFKDKTAGVLDQCVDEIGQDIVDIYKRDVEAYNNSKK